MKIHKDGKIEISSRVKLEDISDLSIVYTPGVAKPCLEIAKDKAKVYEYTSKGHMVAVVSNGSRVLGLGDIGAHAAIPVMESKALLFKKFADIDAFPICLDTQDPERIIEITKAIAPVFGGINLEDISNPDCFYIEKRLRAELDIPVMHDDQHGTAIVALAGLLNALKLVKKDIKDARIIINGAGAAGTAISKLLADYGAGNIIVLDTKGTLYEGREDLPHHKLEIARITNREGIKGGLSDVIKGADVFIGVSKAGVLSREMVASMSEPIILALANPMPEIMPDEAKASGAVVVATGRSDMPNQINNVLAFPGVFKGALMVRSRDINEKMKCAAAEALASYIPEEKLAPDYMIASPFDPGVADRVAEAVARAAVESGVARK